MNDALPDTTSRNGGRPEEPVMKNDKNLKEDVKLEVRRAKKIRTGVKAGVWHSLPD